MEQSPIKRKYVHSSGVLAELTEGQLNLLDPSTWPEISNSHPEQDETTEQNLGRIVLPEQVLVNQVQ